MPRMLQELSFSSKGALSCCVLCGADETLRWKMEDVVGCSRKEAPRIFSTRNPEDDEALPIPAAKPKLPQTLVRAST